MAHSNLLASIGNKNTPKQPGTVAQSSPFENITPVNGDAPSFAANETELAKHSIISAHVLEKPDSCTSNESMESPSSTIESNQNHHVPLSKLGAVTEHENRAHRPSRYPRLWKTIFVRWGPLSGLFAMFLAMSSIFACLGILVGSSGVAVSIWSVQPSEYPAIFTAIANLSMRHACIQRIVIAWWTRALRGSTLSELHWKFRAGTNLMGALTSGRKMGWFGLACIFSTLVTIDQPLLQRATHVISSPISGEFITLNVTIAAEVPGVYGGYWMPMKDLGRTQPWDPIFNNTIPTTNGRASNGVYPSTADSLQQPLTQNFVTGAPLVNVVHGCSGSCRAKLRAPAFAHTCERHEIPVNDTQPMNEDEVCKTENLQEAPPLDRQVFMIGTGLVEGVNETVNVVGIPRSTRTMESSAVTVMP